MSAWLPWLIIIGLLTAVAFLKIGLYAFFIDNDLSLKITVWKLKFSINDTANGKKKQTSKEIVEKRQRTGKKKKSPWVSVLIDHWQEALEMVGHVLTSPCLDLLRVEIAVGDQEPDACVLKYGRICAIVGSLLPPLENTFFIKTRKIHIIPCFEDTEMKILAEVAVSLRLYELLGLVCCILRFGLHLYRHTKFEKKVGQKI